MAEFARDNTRCIAQPLSVKQSISIDFVIDITPEELLTVVGYQLGILLMVMLPIFEIQAGVLPVEEANQFAVFFYSGLVVESQISSKLNWLTMILGSAISKTPVIAELVEPPSSLIRGTDASAGINSPFKGQEISLYIKTPSSRRHWFSEADQMIEFANPLLEQGLKNLQPQYRKDNQASLHFLHQYHDSLIFELSVTNPDNSTHVYEIAHRDGHNQLLSRDGEPADHFFVTSWQQGKSTALSVTGIGAPPADNSRLTVEVPREIALKMLSILGGISQSSVSELLGQSAGVISKVIVATDTSGSVNPGTSLAHKEGLPPQPVSLEKRLPIPSLFSELASQMPENAIVQTMNNGKTAPPKKSSNTVSVTVSTKQTNGERRNQQFPPSPGSNGENEDDKNQPGASLSSVGGGGSNNAPLINQVVRRRLAEFSSSRRSTPLDMLFFRKLSRAGLAQVMIGEDVRCQNCPLVISSTLLKFISTRASKMDPPPFWLEALKKKEVNKEYFVEFDQILYDAMSDHYDDIDWLVNLRTDFFFAARNVFKRYVDESKNISKNPAERFVFTGAEGVRRLVGMMPDEHFFNGNYPITDDLDVLVLAGNFEAFQQGFPKHFGEMDFSIDQTGLSFAFPCVGGDYLFKVYKIQLKSEWTEFLPSIDVAFAAQSDPLPTLLGGNKSVLMMSIDRALKFDNSKPRKYMDRVYLLRAMLPDMLQPEFFHLRESVLPKLEERNSQLLGSVTSSELENKKLKEEIEKYKAAIEQREQEIKAQNEVHHELEQKKQEINTLNEKLESTKNQVKRLSEEIQEQRESQKNAKSSKSVMKSELNRLQLALDISRREVSEKQKEIGREIAKYNDLEQRKNSIERDTKEKLKKLGGELSQLRASLTEKESIISRKEQKIKSRDQEVARLKNQKSSLEEELASKKREVEERVQNYINLKESINEKQNALNDIQRKNTELEEAAHHQRRERTLQLIVGMVPVATLLAYEFFRRKFHDEAEVRCASLKHDSLYFYCVRHQVADYQMLQVLNVIDNLPAHTKVFFFNDPAKFWPGYDSAKYQMGSVEGSSVKQFRPQWLDEMWLLTPKAFISLAILTTSEVHQSLTALKKQITENDTEQFVHQFSQANLLLCGLMPDQYQQDKCSLSLAQTIRNTENKWPCDLIDAGLRKRSCESYLKQWMTKKSSKTPEVVLVPSWRKDDEDNFHWYTPWPVLMNKHRLFETESMALCEHFVDVSGYCVNGEAAFYEFVDNHWELVTGKCSQVAMSDESNVFWMLSVQGMKHSLYGCYDHDLLINRW